MILYRGVQRGAPSTRSEGFMSRNGLPLQLRTIKEAPTIAQLAALDGGKPGVFARCPSWGTCPKHTSQRQNWWRVASHEITRQLLRFCDGADW
jgi:hypothetical protein